MANWELGIVFPPGEGTAQMKTKILDEMTLKLCPAPQKYDLLVE